MEEDQTSLPGIEGDDAEAAVGDATGQEGFTEGVDPEPVVEEASPVVEATDEPPLEVLPEPAPVAPPIAIVAPDVPVGDYAEIAELHKKIQKRHGRNAFDSVSTRWWRRIEAICKAHTD